MLILDFSIHFHLKHVHCDFFSNVKRHLNKIEKKDKCIALWVTSQQMDIK